MRKRKHSAIQVYTPSLSSNRMSSYSKKFVTSFIRDSINIQQNRSVSIVKLFPGHITNPYETYTTININPYTMEEQLSIYPVVIVHQMSSASNVIIDIE